MWLYVNVVAQARYQMSYSIAGVAVSIIILSIGVFITYAGIKSWNYKAINARIDHTIVRLLILTFFIVISFH
ncbi:hypothetical protein [Mycoplasmopsis bovis]|uniref:hypothetical protein n=1 Tax=Mycoplasmopsis bovis TaxID=28903 RepID=UPI003D2CD13F